MNITKISIKQNKLTYKKIITTVFVEVHKVFWKFACGFTETFTLELFCLCQVVHMTYQELYQPIYFFPDHVGIYDLSFSHKIQAQKASQHTIDARGNWYFLAHQSRDLSHRLLNISSQISGHCKVLNTVSIFHQKMILQTTEPV